MVIRGVFLIILLTVALSGICQITPDSQKAISRPCAFRLSPGFNYHLQIEHLDLSPVLTVRRTSGLAPGIGFNYLYHFKSNTHPGTNSYGFNIFTRYFFSPNFFLHGEYLYSDVAYLNTLIYEYRRVRKADFFIGGGYRQPITEKTSGYLTLLVNINKTDVSPYKSLILFKAGMTF